MKSGRFRIVTSLLATASLLAAYFAAEFHHQNSTTALARNLVTEASRSLLQSGNPARLVALVDEATNMPMPDVDFLSRFGELIAMDTPSGEIFVPPLLSEAPGTASFSMRAHFAFGTADIQAQMEYREGAWKLRSYLVTPGAGAM